MALLATVLLTDGREIKRALRDAAAAAAVFAGVVLATVVPVAVSGGLPALAHDALPSAGTAGYQGSGASQYIYTLRVLAHIVLLRVPSPTVASWVSAVTVLAVFILPLLALPLFVWALALKRDMRGVVIGLFTLAALAGALPRADYPHFVAVLPFLVLALVFAWHALRPYMSPALRVALAALVVVVVGARVGSMVLDASRPGDFAMSRLAHFQGAPITFKAERYARSVTGELRAAPRNVYILSLHAGLLYLASGREDPTPYDYPDANGLDAKAQAGVIEAVRSGRIRAIWLDPMVLGFPGWKRSRLIAYIRSAMRPAGTPMAWGQLYTPRPGPKGRL